MCKKLSDVSHIYTVISTESAFSMHPCVICKRSRMHTGSLRGLSHKNHSLYPIGGKIEAT